jgi:hypothetical protein
MCGKLTKPTSRFTLYFHDKFTIVYEVSKNKFYTIYDKKIIKQLKDFITYNEIQMNRAIEQVILRNDNQ